MSGVVAGHQQVAEARRHAVRHAGQLVAPARGEQVHPLLEVGDEQQHPRRPGDERLVVAGHRQPVLERLVLDLDDRVEHQVARRRRAHRRVQDRALLLVGERRRVVGARRAARVEQPDGLVHCSSSGGIGGRDDRPAAETAGRGGRPPRPRVVQTVGAELTASAPADPRQAQRLRRALRRVVGQVGDARGAAQAGGRRLGARLRVRALASRTRRRCSAPAGCSACSGRSPPTVPFLSRLSATARKHVVRGLAGPRRRHARDRVVERHVGARARAARGDPHDAADVVRLPRAQLPHGAVVGGRVADRPVGLACGLISV